MKNSLLKLYIVAFYLCSTFMVFAQPGDEDSTGNGNLESADTPAAPIDDCIWVLALIGLVFVFLKIKNSPKTATVHE